MLTKWYFTFKQKHQQRKLELAQAWDGLIAECLKSNNHFESLFDGSSYIDQSIKLAWKTEADIVNKKIKGSKRIKLSGVRKLTMDQFRQNLKSLERKCNEYNQRFITQEVSKFNSLFNNIEGRALDKQQRTCVVKNEVNNLVIAGAGSGKTTTIVGKVKYLLARNDYQPKELLVLSFTNSSAKEMADRIQAETKKSIDVMTFHKLGKEIIAQVEGKQPSISDISLPRFIEQQFQKHSDDPSYKGLLNIFFLSYSKQFQSPFEFKSKGDYLNYLKDNQIVTFKGEAVKSFEEMEIANFLYIHKINYQYETQYEHKTATRKHSQYKPDFYLQDYGIYLEHFGIDRNGNVPHFFTGADGKSARQTYNDSIRWKRTLHRENLTTLVETFSFEMTEGVLTRRLKDKLEKHGVKFSPMTNTELWDTIQKETPLSLNSFTTLVLTFINHLRANDHSLETVREINRQRNFGYHANRNDCFINIVEPIYTSYINKLKENDEIDFSDMINRATIYVTSAAHKTDYKYIIVDEYQDISLPRYKLIKAIKHQNNTKLFCVGDDWQSIYRFAGSDISFFTNFESYFGYTEKSYIETTYRFPKDLIQLSSNFILKNKSQITKNLKSINANTSSAFSLVYGTSATLDKELAIKLEDLPQNSSVLLLGRYRDDLRHYRTQQLTMVKSHPTNNVTPVSFRQRKDLNLQFMTVHGSKGLQADYVFILNNLKGRMGFPSNINDDPVLNLVLQKEEKFPYAEERRLFYVALTRAKNHVFLMVNKDSKSVFIREIESEYGIHDQSTAIPEPCPRCQSGQLTRRHGKYGTFFGCSHYPRCDYTRKM